MADFDWGNLLYLLAIILFAIFGSRKKKKPAPSTPYNTEQERTSEPGIFEQLFQEEKVEPEPVYATPENNSNWMRREVYNDPFAEEEIKEEIEEEVQPVSHSTPGQKTMVDKDEDTPHTEHAPNILQQILNEPFDLRRAVIYSEILGRRSY